MNQVIKQLTVEGSFDIETVRGTYIKYLNINSAELLAKLVEVCMIRYALVGIRSDECMQILNQITLF